jgi:predicted ATPase/class 3 adenylate cyclase
MTADDAHERERTPTVPGPVPWAPSDIHDCEITEVCIENDHVAVFRALMRENGLGVLVKVFKASRYSEPDATLVRRDHQIAQAARSNCVAKVLSTKRTDRGPALIYADEGACPLEQLAQDGPIGVETTLAIGSALAAAVDELHKEHLVHANLNSNTVWFRAPNLIRIYDFSCARHSSSDAAAAFDEIQDIRYLSPEQIGRTYQNVDQRTDIYAIGIILFRLLAGQLPFDGVDPLRVADAHMTAEATFPSKLVGVLPLMLTKLVAKCLAKDPGERYFSASGLRADLVKCLSEWRVKGAITDFELGRHDSTGALLIPSRLYGREHQTDHLRAFVRNLRRGPPTVLLVSGHPGVGKSTFLNQLSSFVRKETGRFASGKFDQFKRNVPYFSLVQAFQQLVGQLLAEPEDRFAVWKSRILAAAENSARLVIDLIPEIEMITGPQAPVPSLPPNETRNRFNRILTNVVQAFAPSENPLCLFMDDLQWCDPASMELLRHVLIDPNTRHFSFVGAYRSNEIDPSHPLAEMINSFKRSLIHYQHIDLHDLNLADVYPLVRETLSPSDGDVLPLAELLHSRSQGNPLYLTQLLHLLHDKGLLTFDFATTTWRWDLRHIQAEAVTKDILDLLDIRMRALPAETRRVLSTAACIGSTFEAEKVAFAAVQSDALQRIIECVNADLLIGAEDTGNDSGDGPGPPSQPGRFRFLHDRIQQAAFELIPPREIRLFRLQIGHRLLSRLTSAEKQNPQVDVLNNLNYSWELLAADDEKRELARLNLIAGSKARNALAYQDALRYMSTGLKLLDVNAWRDCYDLAFHLHVNALECEYLIGAFDRADELLTLLLGKSRSSLDNAQIYLTKILLDTSEERYESAIRVGIKALRHFGIHYVRNPMMPHLAREFILARIRMRGRRPRDLLGAPVMTDPKRLAALKILVALFPTAYFLSPNLLIFTGLKVVNYSLRVGISPLAATGFVIYGLGLAAALDQYQAGYEFGKFAVELAELGKDDAVICKVLVIFSQFIKFWRDPFDDCFALIDRARKLALNVGDHQYVNYAIIGNISLRFSRGTRLPDLLDICRRDEAFVMESKDAFPTESLLIWRSCILALLGENQEPYSLSNELYDEGTKEDHYRKTANLTLLSYQFTLRLCLLYLFGRYEEAFVISESGEEVIGSAPGYITVLDHYFYRGLTAAGLLAAKPSARRLKKVVRYCLKRLDLFAGNCRNNFLPHALLLRAEVARSAGDRATAFKLYNETIDVAERHKMPQLLGLANERAAICCQAEKQRRLAAWYLASAKAAYAEWGATAKVGALDREFKDLNSVASYSPDGERASAADRGVGYSERFDVAAAAAASQSIAVDKKDRVIVNLMQIIRMQAGAEAAHLIMRRKGMYFVEASAVASSGHAIVHQEAARAGEFSHSIVNYLFRTRKDIIVDDPHTDDRFSSCEHLSRRRPKTVMCVAIIKQGDLLGAIYLEHRGMGWAFDQHKLSWVRMLAAEVGMALWSDKLSRYRDYLHRFAPTIASKEIDADPDSPNLALQERDVSILFADLAGYTRMGELLDQRRVDSLVNRAFAEFIDDIHRFEGVLLRVIGDELLLVFQDDDVQRHARNAASAALAMARTAAHFTEYGSADEPAVILNVGINSGVAALGLQPIEAATGTNWRYDATGTTVNVAARVREFARNGNIVVTAATAGRIESHFQLADLGEHRFKNVSNPLRLYRLIRRIGNES